MLANEESGSSGVGLLYKENHWHGTSCRILHLPRNRECTGEGAPASFTENSAMLFYDMASSRSIGSENSWDQESVFPIRGEVRPYNHSYHASLSNSILFLWVPGSFWEYWLLLPSRNWSNRGYSPFQAAAFCQKLANERILREGLMGGSQGIPWTDMTAWIWDCSEECFYLQSFM